MLPGKIKNLGNVYINFFKTGESDKWDFIIFNMCKRIKEWNKENTPTAELIPMNLKTFESRELKYPKFVIRLNFEKDKDRKGTIHLN